MKKIVNNISRLGVLVLIAGIFHDCDDAFLNTKPLSEVSQADVWEDPALMEAYVNDIYRALQNGGFHEEQLASMTDEAMFIHGRAIAQVSQSNVSADGSHFTDNGRWMWTWENMYRSIRACNAFFEQVENSPVKEDPIVSRLSGEVHFLRAWFYHGLVKTIGGVPIIRNTYDLGGEDFSVTRDTYSDCIDYIIEDLNAAAGFLQNEEMGQGRANYGATLSMKAEVLLYAASDQHDMPTASANSALISGYSNKELLGYTSGDREARWTAARDAAKAVMDLGTYNLAFPNPATPEEAAENMYQMLMTDNSETIWSRYWSGEKTEWGNRIHLINGPNGYHNWAGNVPLQTLVDDYEMMDGTPFDWDNPVHAASPYESRDPRFYATILYDGADWRPRPDDVASRDPANQIQTGTYEKWDPGAGEIITHFGLDTRSSPIEDWNGTRSGYYVKKFYDRTVNGSGERQDVPYPFFRYTEILLNHIEASIELNELGEAATYLNMIRQRAGMPDITEVTQADLRDRYRHERRLELVYEDHRFFDGRRWMIGPTLHRPAQGIQITGTLKPGKQIEVYRYSTEDYDYTYEVIELTNEVRAWQDKMYFTPLHRDELNRNTSLIQNPGYSD